LKTICIDIDGVICTNTWGDYEKAVPIKKSINKINELFNAGNKIILFTARYMGKNNENADKAHSEGFELTKLQLIKWGVKFHELKMGKPTYDILIDDKHYGYSEKWIENL
jgi:hypothetical protein